MRAPLRRRLLDDDSAVISTGADGAALPQAMREKGTLRLTARTAPGHALAQRRRRHGRSGSEHPALVRGDLEPRQLRRRRRVHGARNRHPRRGPEPGDISDPTSSRAWRRRCAAPSRTSTSRFTTPSSGREDGAALYRPGTHKGDFLGLAPTGREFNISGMAWGEWRGDKLVRAWNNIDLLSLLTQIGAVKRP